MYFFVSGDTTTSANKQGDEKKMKTGGKYGMNVLYIFFNMKRGCLI